MMTNDEIMKLISDIATKDSRYTREAYLLVLVGLEHTLSSLGVKRHLSGQELSRGIAEFARKQYGYMVKTVMDEWGIHTTDDFGEIVYILIENSILTKTEADNKADFKAVFDFDNEFSWQNMKNDVTPDLL